MHAIQTLSLLALAGSTLAAPGGWGGWAGNYFHGGDDNHDAAPAAPAPQTATQVDVVTAYTTVTWGGNWGGNKWGGQGGQPEATQAPAAPAAPEHPSEGSSSPAPSTGGSSDGYMGIVEQWRSKLGMSDLASDSQLEANARKTAADGNGQMVHQLNPGSMAQVLAPGSPDEFEKVFVGGWLCERSNLPGLNGICSSMSQGWAYGGETGHADILVSQSYSKIGCACEGGIWACDLA